MDQRLKDLRAAWPTGHRAGGWSTELGHSAGEQVDVLEERYRCSQGTDRHRHLAGGVLAGTVRACVYQCISTAMMQSAR